MIESSWVLRGRPCCRCIISEFYELFFLNRRRHLYDFVTTSSTTSVRDLAHMAMLLIRFSASTGVDTKRQQRQ